MINNENKLIANSLWMETSEFSIARQTKEVSDHFDVAIIGGGISGCSVAYHCANLGLNVCVLEKETIGWGASGRNGGQVNPGLKELPESIISYFGEEQGKKIIKLAGGAPDYVFDLIKKNKIICDAFQGGWVQASYGRHGPRKNSELFRQWSNLNAPIEMLSSGEINSLLGSDYYSGGILDRRGGKLHPLKYVLGLAQAAQEKSVKIYQNAEVLGVKAEKRGYILSSSLGDFSAKKIVMATNAYGSLKNGTLNRNVISVQSVQVATSPLSDNILKTIIPKGHVVSDTMRLLKYFRIAENGRLIMGGRGGTSNKTIKTQIEELKSHVKVMFPALADIEFEYSWGGNIAITLDHYPHIAELNNGVISLSGYNGRGVAMATVLGKVVAEYLSGVSKKDLEFPVKKVQSLPFTGLQKQFVPFAIWFKKLADTLDI